MNKNKNVFLTDDIILDDWDNSDFERYTYCKTELDPEDYQDYNPKEDGDFQEWAENNLEQDDLYSMPMMNTLRYFPSFVSFTEKDNKKCSGATCLIYDNEQEAWAVAMTGGGMDLTPHLLDTFVNLEKGVPLELAKNITLDWSAYVDEKRHAKNCKLLAEAFRSEARGLYCRAKRLKNK